MKNYKILEKKLCFYQLESLLKHCKESIYNTLNVDEILMTTFPKGIENVNNFSVIFFISDCRFSIYRKRQLSKQINQKVELKRFCQYLLQLCCFYFKTVLYENKLIIYNFLWYLLMYDEDRYQ